MQFSTTVRSALVGLCLSAISASATRGLSLSVSGPDSVDGVENLKVTASLLNTGDEALKIVKDPRGVLSTLPTDAFAISNAQGVTPKFTGAKAKFVPEYVAKNNVEDAIVTLEPGQSFEVEHDLSAAYNFTLPGEGAYDIHASNLFHVIDNGEISELRAYQETALKADVKGKLASISRRGTTSQFGKRISYQSCSSSQQSTITSAASAALSYANAASTYANSHTSATTRYTTWFGTYTSSRHSTVAAHYTAIKGYPFTTSGTYDCSCTDSGTYAYVYPDEFGTIYLCPVFWQTTTTGTDSRGGTLIHESSHFTRIAGTDDHVYGQSGAKSLAISNPDQAIDNADNHEYFAENNPAQS